MPYPDYSQQGSNNQEPGRLLQDPYHMKEQYLQVSEHCPCTFHPASPPVRACQCKPGQVPDKPVQKRYHISTISYKDLLHYPVLPC